MQVILTHDNADFDAIAGLLAAKRLFPTAVPVLPRRLNRNTRAFLTLYGSELPFVRPEEMRRTQVTHAILVDTQSLTFLKGMAQDVRVDVIDHHPRQPDLPPDWDYTGEQLGATTTLLVEEIAARSLQLTVVEATLLLLGIYEDTGSLLYTSTTPRDVHAAAWLLDRGARLPIVGEFLHHPLSVAQRALYEALLEQSETMEIEGHSVVVAHARERGFDEEISTLAHRLSELLMPSALFVLVELDGRVQLVARSTTEDIDVSAVASRFGGGGHARASAALVRDRSLEDTLEELKASLPESVHPAVTVADVMSRGVQVLSPEDSIAAAAERMRRTGHEGFPVVRKQKVVGLLTRRAVDRASQFNMLDTPVSRVMEPGNVTVKASDSVAHLQETMIESGWGQVPVIEGNRIAGVVTRTDLIALHRTPLEPARVHEVAMLLEQALPRPVLSLVRFVSERGHKMEFVPYFVGGLVRDLLLGSPVFDIDLVIEGDAIALVRSLADSLGGRVRTHRRFGTAKWMLSPEVWRHLEPGARTADLPDSIDFATARTEFYTHPTAMPLVERSSIKQDLHRRDFTINTLAVRLDPDHWGELLDFYGGENDLREGIIRVLHSLSFVDDPTRMLRAARLESRLGFRLDERSADLIAQALPLLKRVSGDRIRHELELIFREAAPERALLRLSELGILKHVQPSLVCDPWLESRFARVRTEFKPDIWGMGPAAITLLYFALLVYRLDSADLADLLMRLKAPRSAADDLKSLPELRSQLPNLLRSGLPSEVSSVLRPYSTLILATAWLAADDTTIRDHLVRYAVEWSSVEPILSGADLTSMGLKPGPAFAALLTTLRDARLDGKVCTREDEEKLLKRLLADVA